MVRRLVQLAIMEALVGQIYLVPVVALIVGNLARQGGGPVRVAHDPAAR